MEVKKLLKDKRGSTLPFVAMICIIMFFFMAAGIEFIRVFAMVDGVIDRTNEAVTAVAAVNGGNYFEGFREVDAQPRIYEEEVFMTMVTTDEVAVVLMETLNLEKKGSSLVQEVKNTPVLILNGLQVSSVGGQFVTTFTLEIPISFGGEVLPPIKKKVEVKSDYLYKG